MITRNCEQCGKAYALNEHSSAAYFKCPHCHATITPNQVQSASPRQPVALPTAAPFDPTTAPYNSGPERLYPRAKKSSLVPWLLGISAVFFFLLTFAALGVWAYLMTQKNNQVAQDERAAFTNANEQTGDDQGKMGEGIGQPNRKDDSSLAADVNSKRTSNRENVIRYGFFKGEDLNYLYNLDTSFGKKKLTLSGLVSYKPQGDANSSRLVKELKNGIPAGKKASAIGYYTHSTERSVDNSGRFQIPSSPQMKTVRGEMICDESGEVLLSKASDGRHGLGRDAENRSSILSFMFEPLEELGLIRFPDDYSKGWTAERTVTLFRVKDRNRSSSQFASPLGFSSGLYPRSRQSLQVESCEIDFEYTYKLQSETDSKIVFSRKVVGVPSNESQIYLEVERDETIEFDKSRFCIASIKTKGDTKIKLDNVTVSVPFEFSLTLKNLKDDSTKLATGDVKTPDNASLDARRKAAELAAKERQKKREADELAAQEKIDSVIAKYLHADFGKMGWGLSSMAFTPDGNYLCCGHSDRKVSVYDLKRKRRVELIEDLEQLGQVKQLAISPDGQYLLAGGYSGRIQIWKFTEGGLLDDVGKFVGHSSEVKSIAVDPTSTYVISGEYRKVARLWKLDTQREIIAASDFDSGVVGVGFTDGGKTAVAGCRENIIYIDVEKGEVARRREGYRKGVAHDIAFSNDGSQFVVSDGSDLHLYETDTASLTSKIKGERSINWKVAFTPDGEHIISGDRALNVWHLKSKTKVCEISLGKHVNVQTLAASPDGKFLTGYGSLGKTLKVFRSPLPALDPKLLAAASAAARAKPVDKGSSNESTDASDRLADGSLPAVHCTFKDQGWGVDAMSFSPDGRYLYAAKRGIKVYDLERKRTIDNHEMDEAVSAIAATPDGKTVLTGAFGGKITIWKVDDRGQLNKTGAFVGHSSQINSMSISPNSKLVVSGERKRARIWDLESQKEKLSIEFDGNVTSCKVLPNGRAAVISDGKKVTVVEFIKMSIWKSNSAAPSPGKSAISPNGEKLAVTNGSGVKIFDTKTGDEIGAVDAREVVWTVAFSADGNHLLGGGRGKVMIWEWDAARKVAELDAPTSYVQCIAITPDGSRIAAIPGSSGQTLTVFNNPIESD